MSGTAWIDRWLQHPDLRPTHEDGAPTPVGWGYRILGDDVIEFWVQHQLDGHAQPIETTTTRKASDLKLRFTNAGGFERIEATIEGEPST